VEVQLTWQICAIVNPLVILVLVAAPIHKWLVGNAIVDSTHQALIINSVNETQRSAIETREQHHQPKESHTEDEERAAASVGDSSMCVMFLFSLSLIRSPFLKKFAIALAANTEEAIAETWDKRNNADH